MPTITMPEIRLVPDKYSVEYAEGLKAFTTCVINNPIRFITTEVMILETGVEATVHYYAFGATGRFKGELYVLTWFQNGIPMRRVLYSRVDITMEVSFTFWANPQITGHLFGNWIETIRHALRVLDDELYAQQRS